MKNILKVKCCGITQYEQLRELQKVDIDLVGHICYPRSPRNLDSIQLDRFFKHKGQKDQVLVTVDHDIDHMISLVKRFDIQYVQLHGSESVEYCQRLQGYTQVIKAITIRKAEDFKKTECYDRTVDFFLFDTKSQDEIGGTGLQWDWTLLRSYTGTTPFFISGGIKLSDVDRINTLDFKYLYGVDINSRFELKPGIKNMKEVITFMDRLKNGHYE